MPERSDLSELTDIPVFDLRDGDVARHVRQSAERARALRDACLDIFPRLALPLVPALDHASRRWLERSRSPYRPEISRIADALDFSGIWLLNASYQWGCTARAGEERGTPWLLRTLDWPFAGLGRYAEVVQLRGGCGDFYSVTWPGYVGALTAMAPQRFAACVNQAPMRRRTAHRWLRGYDFAVNAVAIWRSDNLMPPDQLLRHVFETAADYAAARRMLETVPVARPVIYTLVGCAEGEHCIIERTEADFITRENEACAANDWVPSRVGWEGRIGMRRFLRSSFEEATDYNQLRRDTLKTWDGPMSAADFGWVREPVLNPYTRLAVAMCPATGVLRVVGYDKTEAALPAKQVTRMREIAPQLAPQAA